MLGKELKEIRIKAGYLPCELADILGFTSKKIIRCENSIYHIPQDIEEALNKILTKQHSNIFTDKVFSRRLFLKHMLTGNEIVDNIYKEADWLKEYNGQKALIKATTSMSGRIRQEFFLESNRHGYFICKKEWLE